MTERLYYTDSYLSYVKARIIDSHPSQNLVYLDRTPFYPSSGGQPHDLGTISGQDVVDVIDEGERVAHRLSGPVEGDNVECQIQWERRYDHMQQHTGQHVLSAVWMELYAIRTLSFHMGAEVSSIELEIKELSNEQLERVEERTNLIAREGRAVSISFEDSSAVNGLRSPTARKGLLRMVTIDGVDRNACGGTHVSSTCEIAPVQLRRTERIRGNMRLEFVCGARAERRTRTDYRIAAELARLNGVSIEDLPGSVGKLRTRLNEADKERSRLVEEIGRLEASVLSSTVIPSQADGMHRVHLEVAAIDDGARSKAQTFASNSRSIALITATAQPGVLIACAPDCGLNVGTILRSALAAAGGRGGGTATFAQGNLSDADTVKALRAQLGFEA